MCSHFDFWFFSQFLPLLFSLFVHRCAWVWGSTRVIILWSLSNQIIIPLTKLLPTLHWLNRYPSMAILKFVFFFFFTEYCISPLWKVTVINKQFLLEYKMYSFLGICCVINTCKKLQSMLHNILSDYKRHSLCETFACLYRKFVFPHTLWIVVHYIVWYLILSWTSDSNTGEIDFHIGRRCKIARRKYIYI